jgi:CHAT domain-containing protein
LNNLAYALRQSGKLTEAEQHLRKAIEIWENLRTKLDDANKVSIFEKQARTYRLLQENLIAQNKPDEALEIAERGRARAFVELLNSRISPNQKEQPITPPNIELLKQIAKEQKATLVQYSIISDTFKVQGKEQTKESELYIWVIKPTGEITFRRSDLKLLWQKENLTLTEFVTISRESLGAIRGSSIIDVKVVAQSQPDQTQRLQQLHNLLIKPIADVLPTDENDRVIFIPHQELFLVPFGALQDESGKYLIEKHTILTAPSIQVLQLTHQQRQRGATRGNDALVVGNPTMPKAALTIGELPQQLPPLQGAEKEAKAIASLLNTQALTGSSATKAAILPKLPSARIIHLATHGILDNIQGLKSAIALAPTSTDNGLLTAQEILELKLNASLVVLSACNTGSGRITGDGVIGLSRSLFIAGTPSVIVSLWAVPDAPTQELMTEFYRQFKLTSDKAQSLRQAMLDMKEKYPDAPGSGRLSPSLEKLSNYRCISSPTSKIEVIEPTIFPLQVRLSKAMGLPTKELVLSMVLTSSTALFSPTFPLSYVPPAIAQTQVRADQSLQQALIAHNKPEAALEVTERGRGRAFVELLASRLSSTELQVAIAPPTIEQIKQIAQKQNATWFNTRLSMQPTKHQNSIFGLFNLQVT